MTKRILAAVLAAALILALSPAALAASTDPSATWLGGTFDQLRAPSDGFCAYREGSLWGFVDSSDGSVAIPARYSAVGDFSEGVAAVCDGGRWGYINRFGALVADCRWSGASSRQEGFALVRDPDSGLYGFLGGDCHLAIDCEYAGARGFSDGFAAVQDADGWFFIDTHGLPLTDERYPEVGDFSGSFAAVRTATGWGVIDRSGVPVTDCVWYGATVSEGIPTLVGPQSCALLGGDRRLRRYTGYTDMGGFHQWLAPVKVKDKWGFAASDGELAIPALYDEVGDFSNGLAYAVRAGTPGVLNRDGGFTPLGGSVDYRDFSGAAAPVKFGSGWALFRADGSYAALGLLDIAGGEGDRFAVQTNEGWRLLAARSAATDSAQFPGASDWAVTELREAGLLGLLDPLEDLAGWSAPITRQQVCGLVVRFYELVGGELPDASPMFSDTSDEAVLRAAALGLVNGDGNGRFRPSDPLTRQEAAVILSRLCALVDFTPAAIRTDLPADMDAVEPWARDAVTALYQAEVFLGDEQDRFLPHGHFSAEGGAITLYRLLHTPGNIG